MHFKVHFLLPVYSVNIFVTFRWKPDLCHPFPVRQLLHHVHADYCHLIFWLVPSYCSILPCIVDSSLPLWVWCDLDKTENSDMEMWHVFWENIFLLALYKTVRIACSFTSNQLSVNPLKKRQLKCLRRKAFEVLAVLSMNLQHTFVNEYYSIFNFTSWRAFGASNKMTWHTICHCSAGGTR